LRLLGEEKEDRGQSWCPQMKEKKKKSQKERIEDLNPRQKQWGKMRAPEFFKPTTGGAVLSREQRG